MLDSDAAVPAVTFHFLAPAALRQRKRLKAFLLALAGREGKQAGALRFIFCTDPYLLRLNRQFLTHDFYTDILTFPDSSGGQRAEGEMYISIDRVRANAVSGRVPFYQEFHRVIFHGVLHLCGYKDKTSRDIALMRSKEDEYLRKYFV